MLHEGKIVYTTLDEDEIEKASVHAAFQVHTTLGPGLLEKVYEACFCHVLKKEGFDVKRQVNVPVAFEEGLRLDVLVNDKVICELKAVDQVNPVWEAQLLSLLKLTNKKLGNVIFVSPGGFVP